MQRRSNFAYFILASVVAAGLTPLTVDAAPQAQIAFTSERDGNREIYTINADGRRDPRRLTDNPQADTDPAWIAPAFAVAPAGKKFTILGWLKQINR